MAEQNQHSSLRADVEFVRQGPALPGQPWEEFIRFCDEHAASDPAFGPLFFRDAANVGRYVRSLEEQLEAAQQRIVEYDNHAGDLAEEVLALREQLEAAVTVLRRCYSQLIWREEDFKDDGLAWQIRSVLERASIPATEASERGTTVGSDGTDSGTPDDGSAERLSRPATPRSEASGPASEPSPQAGDLLVMPHAPGDPVPVGWTVEGDKMWRRADGTEAQSPAKRPT